MKRRSREEWRELITQQKASGLSASQFCKERDISEKYFSTVKYKLKEKPSKQSSFHTLGTLNGNHTITVKCSGVDIQIPLPIDTHWLASLVKQLAQ